MPPHLTETDKDAAHRLKVKGLVAVEDEHKAAQLVAERLHRLRLAGASRAKGRPAEPALQRLRHRQVAPVGERRLHQLLLHAQVLEAVEELGVGHVNRQLLQHVGLLRVKVEAHLRQPLEALRAADARLDQPAGDVALVHKLGDQVLQLLSAQRGLLLQHRVGENLQRRLDRLEDGGQRRGGVVGGRGGTAGRRRRRRQRLLHLLAPADLRREDDNLRLVLVQPVDEDGHLNGARSEGEGGRGKGKGSNKTTLTLNQTIRKQLT